MGRMTVTVEDELLREAQAMYNTSSKGEAIRRALQDAVRRRKREQALRNCGSVALELDADALARMREQP